MDTYTICTHQLLKHPLALFQAFYMYYNISVINTLIITLCNDCNYFYIVMHQDTWLCVSGQENRMHDTQVQCLK